jgi:hypothetical protein
MAKQLFIRLTLQLFVTIILILIFVTASSQTPRFGVDLGFTINRAVYSGDENVEERIMGGFDGGFLLEFPVSKRIMIQPELNYLITGVELNDGTTERSIKLQYAAIPLLVKFNVAGGLNIFAGPQHCFLLSAWTDHSGLISERTKQYYKFSDTEAIIGAEYKCRSGLFFGARYYHGFEQVVEEKMGFEMKNRYVSAKIGYIFNSKAK